MAEKEKFDRSLEHVNIGTIGHVEFYYVLKVAKFRGFIITISSLRYINSTF